MLYTNPRGSTGYGQEFVNGIQYSYPGKDYDDLMAGVDAAIAKGFIDERNLFVCGGSGGGVLTAWIVGHTDRFAAAVSMRPVINWHSFVGTTDGAELVPAVREVPVGRPDGVRRRARRSTYVANVKTPTMVMTGEADLRTPIGPERGVLSRAEDAEEGNAAGPHARGVPRLAAAVAPAAAAAVSAGVVRKAPSAKHDHVTEPTLITRAPSRVRLHFFDRRMS